MASDPPKTNEILSDSVEQSKAENINHLIPLVYDELHRQAHRYLRRERPNHTLQTTALVNEVYLRLAAQKKIHWQNRAHFLGTTASLMRRILIDYARARHRDKRGGVEQNIPLEDEQNLQIESSDEKSRIDLLLLDSALNKLNSFDERQARVIELRYFGGLTVEETAEVLHLSEKTIVREWKMAKAWLSREINSEKP